METESFVEAAMQLWMRHIATFYLPEHAVLLISGGIVHDIERGRATITCKPSVRDEA